MVVAVALEVRRPMAADSLGRGRRKRIACWPITAVLGRVPFDRWPHRFEAAQLELFVDALDLADRIGGQLLEMQLRQGAFGDQVAVLFASRVHPRKPGR